MVRKFFKDSAIYGLATILSKGLTVLMLPIYTAFLSKTQLGVLDLLLGVIAVLSMVIGLDMGNALAREYGEPGELEQKRRYSSTAFWFSVVAFGLSAILFFPAAGIIAVRLTGDQSAASAVRAAVICLAVSGIYMVASQQLRWMILPGKFGIVSVCYTLISLSVTLLLVGKFKLGEAGVLYGTATGSAIGLLLALWFCHGEFKLQFDLACLRKMLAFCVPIVPSSLSVVVTTYVSRFVLENYLGLDEVGVFGVATRVGGLAGLVMLGFGSALTPLIYARQHHSETAGDLARIFKIFVTLASIGVAGLALFAAEIVAVLTVTDYSAAVPLLGLLAPAFLLSQMYIFAPGPWLRRRMWSVAGINFGTAGLAVALNFILVPRFGLFGAAMATLLSAGANFGINMAVSQKLYPVPHRWLGLGGVTAAGIFAITFASLVFREISVANFIWKLLVLIAVVISIIAMGGVERRWFPRADRGLAGRLWRRRKQ